jgi:hypothetical protein
MTKTRRNKWAGYVAHTERLRYAHTPVVEKLEKTKMKKIVVVGRIIVK